MRSSSRRQTITSGPSRTRYRDSKVKLKMLMLKFSIIMMSVGRTRAIWSF